MNTPNEILSRPKGRGWMIAPALLATAALCAAQTNAPAADAANAPATNSSPAQTTEPKAGETTGGDKDAPKIPPEVLTPQEQFEGGKDTFKNWIEFSGANSIVSGNRAQYQRTSQNRGFFGGIEDFHLEGEIAKGSTMTMDMRAITDSDYRFNLGVEREKLGYLKFHVEDFHTRYDGDGGYFPATGSYYPYTSDSMDLERREISIEGGLTLEHKPKVVVKYTHSDRDGDKDSTIWGQTHQTGDAIARGLAPTAYDISERRDAVELDVSGQVKSVDLGAGLSYEKGKMDDALDIDNYPGESVERKITDREKTDSDLMGAHAYAESWLKKNLLFSVGALYSRIEETWTGSRVYGADYGMAYQPLASDGFGYTGFNGQSRVDEYVMNLNLFYAASPHLSIVPSVRVQKEESDADGSGLETLAAYAPADFFVNSDESQLDVRERLDLRYNGFTNWVLWARSDTTEGSGNMSETGGLGKVQYIGVGPVNIETADDRFFQKYSAGLRWYPARRTALDIGGYYKDNQYDYDPRTDSALNTLASVDRYPAFLINQSLQTYDGNARLSLHPWSRIALVTRYEYQYSFIHTRPDNLPEVQSATMTSHIIGADASWTPWTRLFLQSGISYVLSDTKTPASDASESANPGLAAAILKAQNNYWTANVTTGLVLDKKTDLNLSYFYYVADNFTDNSPEGVPYGSGAKEHGVAATLVRRLSKHVRWKLRYNFYRYTDDLYGGNRDFDAHVVFSSLQYRF